MNGSALSEYRVVIFLSFTKFTLKVNFSFFKKWAMRQYWRMQQSQAIVSLLLWGTTITLLVWPLIEWRFSAECISEPCFSNELFGISSTYFALVGIFFSVMLSVLTIGFLYDQVFSLWTERSLGWGP